MCLVEFTERASYYGTAGPFNNFLNNKLPKGGNGAGAVAKGEAGLDQSAGALGQGSVTTSAITNLFKFLAYIIPIWGGIVADNQWGRFKTICVGTAVGAVAHFLLVVPAIPSVITHPKGSLGAFIASIVILAFAAGFIKPSLGPMLCDQAPVKLQTIAYQKKGGGLMGWLRREGLAKQEDVDPNDPDAERVIIDPQTTIERYLLIFYLCINVGSCFQVATQYAERFVGFWLAFLLPGILYMFLPILLWWASARLVKLPPQGSVVPDVWAIIKLVCSNGGWKKIGRGGDTWWNVAKPSYILERDGTLDETRVIWDDQFVEEVRQTFAACGVFLLIPFFGLADGGIGNQLNDMSVAMKLNGVPNDLISNFNAITIVVATPIVTYWLYPFLERIGWPMTPMWRMFCGFQLGTLGCIAAALLQWRVYATSPCGHYATDCDAGVSPVSLWYQILPIAIPAIGEIFVNVTAYELAYTRSPPRMKGLVYSLALFNTSIGAIISLALSKVIADPNLVVPWIVLAGVSFVCGCLFPTYFRHLDTFTFQWSAEERAAIQKRHQDSELGVSQVVVLGDRDDHLVVGRLNDNDKY